MIADNSPGDERADLLARLGRLTTVMESITMPCSVKPLLSLDLTVQQLKVLTALVTSRDGGSGSTLATLFGVTMASMSGTLDRLVARGLAERSPSPLDHRVTKVHATSLGRNIVQNLVAARPEFNAQVLAGLSLSELQALEIGWRALSREMDQLRHASDC